MKFKYVGDGDESPIETVAYGYKFTLNGDSVEVKDGPAIAKLLANHTFTHDGKPEYVPPPKGKKPKEEKSPEIVQKGKNGDEELEDAFDEKEASE